MGRRYWCAQCGCWVGINIDEEKQRAEHTKRYHEESMFEEHPDLTELDADLERWYDT